MHVQTDAKVSDDLNKCRNVMLNKGLGKKQHEKTIGTSEGERFPAADIDYLLTK